MQLVMAQAHCMVTDWRLLATASSCSADTD
jgi:hypothetical protein